MGKLSEAQLNEKDALDTLRTAVRLKHRIAARRELNELEEQLVAELNDRKDGGRPYRVDIPALFKGELPS